MMVLFRRRLGKILILQKFSGTWEPDFKEKTTAYKYFHQNGNDAYWQHRLKVLQDRLNNSIESSKEKYYNRMASKLQNTKKNSKYYWSLLKIFLNNKKIPLIPLLFRINRFFQISNRKPSYLVIFLINNNSLTN